MSPVLEIPQRIRTERLVLRPLVRTDLDDIHAYQSDPEVVRFLPWPVRNRDESAGHLAQRMSRTRLEKDGDNVALAIDVEGTVVGDLTLIVASAENRGAEIGWVLHPDFRGRGYATEAARAGLGLLFGDWGAHRVAAKLDPRNVASAAVCMRLGMRHEARFLHNELLKGEWLDTDVYAILEDEWRGQGSS